MGWFIVSLALLVGAWPLVKAFCMQDTWLQEHFEAEAASQERFLQLYREKANTITPAVTQREISLLRSFWIITASSYVYCVKRLGRSPDYDVIVLPSKLVAAPNEQMVSAKKRYRSGLYRSRVRDVRRR
jgi:hypothetical protein